MDEQSDSRFVTRAKIVFQFPGLMDSFSAGGGSVSASSSETMDNSSMLGSETTTAGADRANDSSKIGERG